MTAIPPWSAYLGIPDRHVQNAATNFFGRAFAAHDFYEKL
jgi:hypothetical protein